MANRTKRANTAKNYNSDYFLDDDDVAIQGYVLEDKIKQENYSESLVKVMEDGSKMTFEYFQEYGFSTPLHFKNTEGLGLGMPSSDFSVQNVKRCVGSTRVVDVVDVKTQENTQMTMKQFAKYYKKPADKRQQLLNVISLEFSNSSLDKLVKRPEVVNYLDWIDLAWPLHLKHEQTDTTNEMTSMKFPKVQKYCLMSVEGCYTDFHIDFGGTSVWYHLFKGSKLFWLIEPTESNLKLFEKWTKSGNQDAVFFADLVPECQLVRLNAGDTFMIPSGWIHSVYTPKDSLVFGGNFLNSFTIPKQLEIWKLEDRTKVKYKYRFPFYMQLHWYVLDRYVFSLSGKSFLTDEFKKLNNVTEMKGTTSQNEHINLTKYEVEGLKKMIEKLQSLAPNKRDVPDGIVNAEELLLEASKVFKEHLNDDHKLALTGKPVACWSFVKDEVKPAVTEGEMNVQPTVVKKLRKRKATKVHKTPKAKVAGKRFRKARCKTCENCLRENCQDCAHCHDMKKYGGPGKLKQSCQKRKCLNLGFEQSVVDETEVTYDKSDQSNLDISSLISSPTPDCSVTEEQNSVGGTPAKVQRVDPSSKVVNASIPESPSSDDSSDEEQNENVLPSPPVQLAESKDISEFMVVPVKFSGAPKKDYNLQVRECNLTRVVITKPVLKRIVKEAPTSLILENTQMNYEQLEWILKNCENLRSLNISENSGLIARALENDFCPMLTALNISNMSGLDNHRFRNIFTKPKSLRPGRNIHQNKLAFCNNINISGLKLSSVSFGMIAQLMYLETLNVSYTGIKDCDLECICKERASTLKHLNCKGCLEITSKSVDSCKFLTSLEYLNMNMCKNVGLGHFATLFACFPALTAETYGTKILKIPN